jgi:hypothetical protein
MKVTISENPSSFFFEFTAETQAEAATLASLGMNATKELRCASTHILSDGVFYTQMAIGARKNKCSEIPKAT